MFAPTIFHVLCLTDTAIRRCPLVAVLGQGKGAQPGARRALAAGRLRLVQAAVVAALQRSLLVRVLGLAHHREGHSAKRLQEKPNGRGSLLKGLLLFKKKSFSHCLTTARELDPLDFGKGFRGQDGR